MSTEGPQPAGRRKHLVLAGLLAVFVFFFSFLALAIFLAPPCMMCGDPFSFANRSDATEMAVGQMGPTWVGSSIRTVDTATGMRIERAWLGVQDGWMDVESPEASFDGKWRLSGIPHDGPALGLKWVVLALGCLCLALLVFWGVSARASP